MAKKRTTETPVPTEQEATGRLIEVLQSLTQEVETLNQQVGSLTQHAQVLTEAIDDVRAELGWAIKNLHRPAWAPTVLDSMPHDALAEDFGARVNHVKPEALPPEAMPPSTTTNEKRQRELWD